MYARANKTRIPILHIFTSVKACTALLQKPPQFELTWWVARLISVSTTPITLLCLQMNPNGKLPLLVTPGGPIFESNAICRFISTHSPQPSSIYPEPSSPEVSVYACVSKHLCACICMYGSTGIWVWEWVWGGWLCGAGGGGGAVPPLLT